MKVRAELAGGKNSSMAARLFIQPCICVHLATCTQFVFLVVFHARARARKEDIAYLSLFYPNILFMYGCRTCWHQRYANNKQKVKQCGGKRGLRARGGNRRATYTTFPAPNHHRSRCRRRTFSAAFTYGAQHIYGALPARRRIAYYVLSRIAAASNVKHQRFFL